MSDRFGTEVAASKERIEGTWTVDGETYDLITEDTSKGTLELIEQYMQLANRVAEGDELPEDAAEDLDNFPWEEEDNEKDIIESVVDAKLIKPEVNPQDAPIRKLRALFEGMMQAWSEGKQVRDAKDDMPLEEGNR